MQCWPTVAQMPGTASKHWRASYTFLCASSPSRKPQHTRRCSAGPTAWSFNGHINHGKAPSAVAVADPDVSSAAADPALEALIDRWLSNRLASSSTQDDTSSSAASSSSRKTISSNSSRRNKRSKQQSAAAGASNQAWIESLEAVLGPVSLTLDSLNSLDDETDELFILNDSLSQLAGSLQELQTVAGQLQRLQQQQQQAQQQTQQQQDQLPDVGQQQQQQQQRQVTALQGWDPASAAAPDYAVAALSSQLQKLLAAAATQVPALPDSALLNLLAIAVVVLTASTSSSSSSSSSSAARAASQQGISSVAAAAVRSALTELAQRPAAAKGLSAPQLTSLSVVLHRLGKQLRLSHVIPRDVLTSVYQQLRGQIKQFTPSQLAVVFWCLSGLGLAPPTAAVTTVLETATAAVAEGRMDGMAIRRLAAGLLNLRPYLAAAVSGSNRGRAAEPASQQLHATKVQRAVHDFVAAVSQFVPSQVGSSTDIIGSSSTVLNWKVILSVAQLCGLYTGTGQEGQLVRLLAEHTTTASDAAAAVDPFSSLCDAAAAAGYMMPYWQDSLSSEEQQRLLAALIRPWQQQQWSFLQSFLDAVSQSCAVAAAAGGIGTSVHETLDSITAQVLLLSQQHDHHQQQQQQSSELAVAGQAQCYILLLRAYLSLQYRQSPQLQELCKVAAAAAGTDSAVAATAGAAAAGDVAAAVCVLQAAGWQEQLTGLQQRALSHQQLEGLSVGSLLQLATAARCAGTAAGPLGAAAVSQLIRPEASRSLTVHQAVELVQLLAEHLADPVLQQQQQQQQVADQPAEQAAVMFQQCLCCLDVIQSNARKIVPSQVVPLLGTLLQLQQHWQRQQQRQQQDQAAAYGQLHREVLAAVVLRLEDAVQYLQPQQVGDSVKLLALLQTYSSSSSSSIGIVRPALTAVLRAVVDEQQQYSSGQLVWILWGLAKLNHIKQHRFMRILQTVLGRLISLDRQSAADRQPQPQQQQQTASIHSTLSDSTLSQHRQPTAAAAVAVAAADVAAPLDQLVAVLWVCANKNPHSKDLPVLLQMILRHSSKPSIAQVSSVMWSFTRLWQGGSFGQQQQQQVLQWMEQWVGGSAAAAAAVGGRSARSVVNIIWATHKLGHTPDVPTQQALLAALHHQQHQQQQQQLTPAELSCLLYCVSRWASNSSSSSMLMSEQQLQSMEQQLVSRLEAAAAATVVDSTVVDVHGRVRLLRAVDSGAAHSDDGQLAAAAAAAQLDGPSVCSCCHGLAKLGLNLQPRTLQLAEQYIAHLIPLSPPPDSTAVPGSTGTAGNQQQQQQQQHVGWLAPPSAAGLALFGDACRRCAYNPADLLMQFRKQLLLKIAQKGPAALLKLTGVTARRNALRAAAAAAASNRSNSSSSSSRVSSGTSSPRSDKSGSGTSSPRTSSSSSGNGGQLQQQLAAALQRELQRRQQHAFHANAIVNTLLFLRHTQYSDPALLQQLESLISNRPISLQLTGQQLVMALSAFYQLGHYPGAWWTGGLRRLLSRHVDKLTARDTVELLQVLSAWADHVHIKHGQATFLKQSLLPRALQRLLGLEYVPRQQQQAAAGGSASASLASASLASVTLSSRDGADVSSSSSSSDTTVKQAELATAPEGSVPPVVPATGSSSSRDMLSRLTGSEVVSLLQSMLHLDLLHVTTPQIRGEQLMRQVLKRLQQVWSDLTVESQVAAVHTAGRLHHDITNMLNPALIMQWMQHQQAGAGSREITSSSGGGGGDAVGGSDMLFGSVSLAARVLWMYGNVGKQPGLALLESTLQTITAAAAATGSNSVGQLDSGSQQQQLPLREISNALYAAAVLHELSHPAAAALVQQLVAAAESGDLLRHPDFDKQSRQLAVCLLASQLPPPPPTAAAAAGSSVSPGALALVADAGNTAGVPQPSSTTSSSSNPWFSMSSAVQQRLIEAWRRQVISRSGSRLQRQQKELVACCRELGLKCRANAITDDGCVCIDVAATSPAGELVAIELLGPTNAAINTQRPLGPARVKWRLLAARGYRVIVINTWHWQNSRGRLSARSQEAGPSVGVAVSLSEAAGTVRVSDEQVAFLQSRLLAAGIAAAGIAAAGAGQQQQQQDAAAAVEGGDNVSSSRSNRFSALERPIRRPGAWR